MEFDEIIGRVLRISVLISVTVIILGVILLFLRDGIIFYKVASISTEINSSSFSYLTLIKGLEILDPLSYIYLGLILLILTPILRVVLGIVQFIREGNKIYTIITIIVLFNILFSIFILPLILK